jgi:hypothetical protein
MPASYVLLGTLYLTKGLYWLGGLAIGLRLLRALGSTPKRIIPAALVDGLTVLFFVDALFLAGLKGWQYIPKLLR